MAYVFPRALLREKTHAWNIAGVAVSGGQNAGASMPMLVRSDGGGFWTCKMSAISLSGRQGVNDTGRDRQKRSLLLWRALRQLAQGGVNALVVPRNDALARPWPAGIAQGLEISYADGTFFDDGVGFEQPIIDITCGAASLRANSLAITVNRAGELLGGESFSIDHPTWGWRMYEIATVDMASSTSGTITFNPPLREAVADGTRLEFDRPRCTMRLAQPSSMDLTVQPWTFNTADVDFVEAPPS
ncbi:hypothetical protein [Bradyrhizobium sp. BR 10261]|uniref:hypothetical protein n=1 Tax=Bradyrhizobium sp. BR 10261 TaxID=2749992 RepID=UPI001C64D14A|nr:hypothetical protein [Bradyrhizobium sp. BR 10261]MBW7967585.1 hypothetical protein [Bradyrhizobium sp. BR 10261]